MYEFASNFSQSPQSIDMKEYMIPVGTFCACVHFRIDF